MRDQHDPSHSHYQANQFAPDDLPAFVDLRPHLTEVEDQGDLGSCTANALAGAVEYLEKRVSNNGERVSRLFIYWNERDLEGDTGEDAGAAISDGIKALKERGVCSEEVWPYDIDSVFEQPHDDAFGDAEPHTIDEAHRVRIELHDMRHCLAEGYPFAFGLQIYKPFEDIGRAHDLDFNQGAGGAGLPHGGKTSFFQSADDGGRQDEDQGEDGDESSNADGDPDTSDDSDSSDSDSTDEEPGDESGVGESADGEVVSEELEEPSDDSSDDAEVDAETAKLEQDIEQLEAEIAELDERLKKS